MERWENSMTKAVPQNRDIKYSSGVVNGNNDAGVRRSLRVGPSAVRQAPLLMHAPSIWLLCYFCCAPHKPEEELGTGLRCAPVAWELWAHEALTSRIR